MNESKPLIVIGDEWDSYARAVLPADAHETQRIETRRAFYGGAWAILNGLRRTIGDESVSEEQGVAAMMAAQAEIAEFYRAVRTRKPGF